MKSQQYDIQLIRCILKSTREETLRNIKKKKKKMTLQKRIVKESVTVTVDHKTGEITEETTRNDYKVAKEPDFIKLYINDLSYLLKLPNNDVLFCLLKKMNYDGEVTLVKASVDDICEKVNLKNSTYFYSILKKYIDKEILYKKAKGIYLFNPYFFARGAWGDIQQIRMSIQYTPELGRQINIERMKSDSEKTITPQMDF